VLSGYITTLFLKKQAETRRFERRPFVNITMHSGSAQHFHIGTTYTGTDSFSIYILRNVH
jgi:hypothetical protein